ncbi:MAG TPA: TIGR03000 domain-containing protein [Gemmataceae bacterium]|nr:TIGR03000 domain-containing protein [Gemmataceae bacterium]
MQNLLLIPLRAAILAAALVLVLADRSDAQTRTHPGHNSRVVFNTGTPFWFWPSYGYGGYAYPYYAQSYWYNYSYWYSSPGYFADPIAGYQRMFVLNMLNNPPPSGEPRADNAAKIEVTLPKDAELWFDGKKTTQTGGVRHFATPPLNPGQVFYYEISASWLEYGSPVTRTTKVEVYAGQKVKVNLAQITE